MATSPASEMDDQPAAQPPPPPMKCAKCEQTLSEQRYKIHDGMSYCIHCYEANYANVICAACGCIIAVDSKVTYTCYVFKNKKAVLSQR